MELKHESLGRVFYKGSGYYVVATNDWDAADVVAGFFSIGMLNNERCIYYTDSMDFKRLHEELDRLGMDMECRIKSGQLQIKPSATLYSEYEHDCAKIICDMTAEAKRCGFDGIRVAAEAGYYRNRGLCKPDLAETISGVDGRLKGNLPAFLSIYNIDVLGVDNLFELIEKTPKFIIYCDGSIHVHGSDLNSRMEDTTGMCKALFKQMLSTRQRLRWENDILDLISGLAGEVAYKGNFEEILNLVLKRIMAACMADMCMLKIFKGSYPETDEDVVVYRGASEEFINELKQKDMDFTGFIYDAVSNGQYFLSDYTDSTPECIKQLNDNFGVKSSAAVPVILDTDTVGFLYLASKRPNHPFNRQMQFLMESMKIIASVLYNQSKLYNMYNEISEAQRMKALGVLTYGIAHEFNNLLTPILGFAQIIKQKVDCPDLKMYVDTIEKSAKEGAMIVKRVQELNRLGLSEFKVKFCIDSKIQDVVNMTKSIWKEGTAACGKRIKLTTQLNGGYILANPSKIREVIMNILYNAVDAIQCEGQIDIKSWCQEDSVFFSISDNGIGMSEEVINNLFTPFFTTKNEHGTGLGMPIAYTIVHWYGGNINVRSKQGEGTEITVRLPMAK